MKGQGYFDKGGSKRCGKVDVFGICFGGNKNKPC